RHAGRARCIQRADRPGGARPRPPADPPAARRRARPARGGAPTPPAVGARRSRPSAPGHALAPGVRLDARGGAPGRERGVATGDGRRGGPVVSVDPFFNDHGTIGVFERAFYAGREAAEEVEAILEWRPQPRRVLDVGCNAGLHALEWARRGV